MGHLGRCCARPLDAAPDDIVIPYIHGGGFRSGLAGGLCGLAAQLALATKVRVLLPEYRLAPEDPFPAGLDDCLTAFDHAASLVPGGANLALAVLLCRSAAIGDRLSVSRPVTAHWRHPPERSVLGGVADCGRMVDAGPGHAIVLARDRGGWTSFRDPGKPTVENELARYGTPVLGPFPANRSIVHGPGLEGSRQGRQP